MAVSVKSRPAETVQASAAAAPAGKITRQDVERLMKAATRSVHKVRRDVQAALVALVQHAREHGDKRLIIQSSDWIKAMGGLNTPAIVEYLCRFGGVEVAGGGFAAVKGARPDLAGARGTEWWSLKKQPAFAGFDLARELERLLKKHAKAVDTADAEGAGHMVHAPEQSISALARMQAALARDAETRRLEARLSSIRAETRADTGDQPAA